jgi:hypothetical protein
MALDEFIDEMLALSVVQKGPDCSVGTAMQSLSGEEREGLAKALLVTSITGKAIQEWLKRRNLVVPHTTIARHRRGDCKCPK